MAAIGNLIQPFFLPWFYEPNNWIISKLHNHIVNKIEYFIIVLEGWLRMWLVDLVNQIQWQPGCIDGGIFLMKHQNKTIS